MMTETKVLNEIRNVIKELFEDNYYPSKILIGEVKYKKILLEVGELKYLSQKPSTIIGIPFEVIHNMGDKIFIL